MVGLLGNTLILDDFLGENNALDAEGATIWWFNDFKILRGDNGDEVNDGSKFINGEASGNAFIGDEEWWISALRGDGLTGGLFSLILERFGHISLFVYIDQFHLSTKIN